MSRLPCLSLLACLAACTRAGQRAPTPVQLPADAAIPMALAPGPGDSALLAFGREAGRHQIVLLGENGHGVREHTQLKVAMVRYLHEHEGFDLVAFESGYWECAEADGRLDTVGTATTMRSCLLTQLQHAELQPLFEYVRETRGTAHPIHIAGIDMQVQGAFTRGEPAWLRRELQSVAPALADTVAALDSILIEKSFRGTDTLRAWLVPHLEQTFRLFDSLSLATRGDLQTTLRGVRALLERERLRTGDTPPAAFYEVRDRQMSETIARLAGTGERPRRKVVVWLHNDHARQGEWVSGGLRVRATGQFLRRNRGLDLYSVGFLMGGGTYTDNRRRPVAVAEPGPASLEAQFRLIDAPAAWLSLRASPAVRRWASLTWPYSRGDQVQSMRPIDEFDALVYVREVGPPSYELR